MPKDDIAKPADFITIELNDQEFRFDPDAAFRGYDTFINTMGSGKLTKAGNNYCVSAIHNDDLVAFRELKKKNPGVALQIAGVLADNVAPDLEVTVKKR